MAAQCFQIVCEYGALWFCIAYNTELDVFVDFIVFRLSRQ